MFVYCYTSTHPLSSICACIHSSITLCSKHMSFPHWKSLRGFHMSQPKSTVAFSNYGWGFGRIDEHIQYSAVINMSPCQADIKPRLKGWGQPLVVQAWLVCGVAWDRHACTASEWINPVRACERLFHDCMCLCSLPWQMFAFPQQWVLAPSPLFSVFP